MFIRYGVPVTRFLRAADDGGAGGGAGGSEGDKTKTEDKSAGADDVSKKLAEAEARAKKAEDEKADLLKDVMKHKDKAKATKEELETIRKELSETLGENVTLADVKKLLAERKTREEEDLKKAGDFEALRERLVKEHQKTVADKDAALEKTTKELTEKLVGKDALIHKLLISNSFASSTFRSEELVLTPAKAERLYGDHFKVEEKDGTVQVVAYLGKEPLVDANGKPLDFDAALREIVNKDPEKESVMRSKAAPGAGSGAANSGTKELPKDQPRGVAAIQAGLTAKK